ncbi:MAG: cytochrome P450 [Gammaproteobacteria bacterium]|jgi:cytochrome P450|nr:cytochrome P450 [Gammaproteobacteria bacterium]
MSNSTKQDKISIEKFDPRHLPDDFYVDPYPYYRQLREDAPVHLCPDGSYFLSKHAELRKIYRDPKTFSSDKKALFKPLFGDTLLYEHHTTSLVFNDPPLHTHVRRAIGDALSQKTIVAMEAGLKELVDELLNKLEEKQQFDFVEDYASIIPIEVISNLLRVPQEDRDQLRRWAVAILGALEFDLPKDKLDLGNQCVKEFLDYLKDFVADRKNNLSDDDDDILSRLIRWDFDGFQLSEKQLFHQCIFLLNAGHDTTTNLIANGMQTLLAHPDQLEKLKQEPDLIKSAVEEFLRFESPVQLGNRMTTTDVEIAGVEIPANTNLNLGIGAANRDPDIYSDPETLDITRNPRDHHAFAGGIHLCAGLNVARLEAQIAIPAILKRFPDLRSLETPVYDRRARFRAILTMPVSVN